MKAAAYIGGVLGLALLTGLIIRSDFATILQTLAWSGYQLFWLLPYRALYFGLYATGWLCLLAPYDPDGKASPTYVFWVTCVREAVDRLLPVASVGGAVVGVRLLSWRGIAAAAASATVITEVLLTLIGTALFTVVGLLLLMDLSAGGWEHNEIILGLLLFLPVPVFSALLLRKGSLFQRAERLIRPFTGASGLAQSAAELDQEIQATLRRRARLLIAGLLQFAALCSGAFEIWLAMRLFGHPIGAAPALMLESLTQALRTLAFVVPAGIGVQEAGLILFGHVLGVSTELALAVSAAKRMREVLWGLPCLASWHWAESGRLSRLARHSS